MAKVIRYKFMSCEINHGTEEAPVMEQIILEKIIPWSESNEEIAKREAYGEITPPYDDSKEEPEQKPTQEQRIAELEAALEMLLSGVTEE